MVLPQQHPPSRDSRRLPRCIKLQFVFVVHSRLHRTACFVRRQSEPEYIFHSNLGDNKRINFFRLFCFSLFGMATRGGNLRKSPHEGSHFYVSRSQFAIHNDHIANKYGVQHPTNAIYTENGTTQKHTLRTPNVLFYSRLSSMSMDDVSGFSCRIIVDFSQFYYWICCVSTGWRIGPLSRQSDAVHKMPHKNLPTAKERKRLRERQKRK